MISSKAVGRRVVVRFRRENPESSLPFSDVVGELLSFSDSSLSVQTIGGPVSIDSSRVVAARVVGPNRARILALEATVAKGWQAAENVEFGGWLLRANAGWSARANSVLPSKTPTVPMEPLLGHIEDFYQARGLDPRILIPMPTRGFLDAELAKRCWATADPGSIMSAPLGSRPNPDLDWLSPQHTAPDVMVRLEATLSATWKAHSERAGSPISEAGESLLMRHHSVRFAVADVGGQVAGVARGVLDDGWLGISAVEVPEGVGGSHVAAALIRALQEWGRAGGASQAYLQVEATDTAVLACCDQLGFAEHHRYYYRVRGSRG